eukprot:TRINITY_DN39438_c0_g1_i1.p1 TRINITY_DN39438_c0_g1~~TRINITY_DN39438_c0_g1_i1.p1  ORF type:complete len:125 (+),score=18.38 TRINITY_DN39438_c0_g1_i1:63-437(+)
MEAERRVRFGEVRDIEYVPQDECMQVCEATTTSVGDDEVSTDEFACVDSSAATVRSQYDRAKGVEPSCAGASSDQGGDDDTRSLVDAFSRFESVRTKTRSLVPRLEMSVELDLTRSKMWMRRKS